MTIRWSLGAIIWATFSQLRHFAHIRLRMAGDIGAAAEPGGAAVAADIGAAAAEPGAAALTPVNNPPGRPMSGKMQSPYREVWATVSLKKICGADLGSSGKYSHESFEAWSREGFQQTRENQKKTSGKTRFLIVCPKHVRAIVFHYFLGLAFF